MPIIKPDTSRSDVKTERRFVQWEVGCQERLKKTNPFIVGIWRWHLMMCRVSVRTFVEIISEPSHYTKNMRPAVSFSMKLLSFPPNQTTIAHDQGTIDESHKTGHFVLAVDRFVPGKFLVEIKFLDMKITNQLGGEPVSIWTSYMMKPSPLQSPWSGFASMLQEGILTDIAINTADGSIKAHRVVLAARSTVLRNMFLHNFKEKQLSTVDISDMSFVECQAFINYLYDNLHEKEFIAHRFALLGAADKYDVSDLKVACLDSLLQDIDTENLIERLQVAHLYRLSELKRSCVRLLVDFRKLYEIEDDFNEFIRTADNDLVVEILQYVLHSFTCVG